MNKVQVFLFSALFLASCCGRPCRRQLTDLGISISLPKDWARQDTSTNLPYAEFYDQKRFEGCIIGVLRPMGGIQSLDDFVAHHKEQYFGIGTARDPASDAREESPTSRPAPDRLYIDEERLVTSQEIPMVKIRSTSKTLDQTHMNYDYLIYDPRGMVQFSGSTLQPRGMKSIPPNPDELYDAIAKSIRFEAQEPLPAGGRSTP